MTHAAASLEDEEAFPRAFGPYLLVGLLAKGGMGAVHLAKHGRVAGIEKTCVLKTLKLDLGEDPEYVRRFVDEARVVVQLHHRNICSVFDVGKVGRRYYLAMEYVAGRDLRTLLDRAALSGRPLPASVPLHVVSEVLEALDYAHRLVGADGVPMGLVHRDVSPHNVMVGFEGDVKLIDFGLAVSTTKAERTESNVVMGKVAYMAPEQARGDVLDGRVDQFAAAVLAYELVVGERYYAGQSQHEIWYVAGQGGFRPRRWSDLDPPLAAILDRALQAAPTDRYATCGELREELERYRFERRLSGASSALRIHMREVFDEDRAQASAMLRRFDNVAALPVRDEDSAEPTQSFAVAPSARFDDPTIDQSLALTLVVPKRAAAAKSDAPDSSSTKKRLSRVAAISTAAVSMLALGVLFVVRSPAVPPSDGAAMVASMQGDALLGAAVVAKGGDGAGSSPTAGGPPGHGGDVVAKTTTAVPEAGVAENTAPLETKPAADPQPVPNGQPTNKEPMGADAVARADDRTGTPKVPRPKLPRLSPPKDNTEKVAFLRARCPTTKCAKDVVAAQATHTGTTPTVELLAWRKALDACVKKCSE